ncbi:MAG TPA: IS110 family transposase [Rhodopila sp.]|nr:IS110 family transposase [Rhodopila sp.]
MKQIKRIGIDTSKAVFTLHCVDQEDHPVHRGNFRRSQLLAFLRQLPAAEIALEACGSAHYWGREISRLGHQVRLIPPQYVKPFVKRAKNDRNDAEAICEAASRPSMPFVPIKSAQQQAQGMVLKLRETLVAQRTRLINTLRGHAAEFGLIAAKGTSQVGALLTAVETAPDLPADARAMLVLLAEEVAHLDSRITEIEARLHTAHRANPLSRRLAGIPGVGMITALTLAMEVNPAAFKSGRHLSAWMGLTPREHSTGGKQRLGGISRAGHERLRQLLVLGATTVIRYAAKPEHRLATPWLTQLLARRPRKLAAVALANKTARIVWAMMMSGEAYRQPAGTA